MFPAWNWTRFWRRLALWEFLDYRSHKTAAFSSQPHISAFVVCWIWGILWGCGGRSAGHARICWNRRIFLGYSMRFHGFLCDSMPTPLADSRRFFMYSHTRLFFSCFQKVLSFWDVYNEPEPPQLFENWHTFTVCTNSIHSEVTQSRRPSEYAKTFLVRSFKFASVWAKRSRFSLSCYEALKNFYTASGPDCTTLVHWCLTPTAESISRECSFEFRVSQYPWA